MSDAPPESGKPARKNSPASMRNSQGTARRLPKAKSMRSNPTDAEKVLWRMLRDHRFLGLKFKRQAPIGPYIVDFLCPQLRLVVEADGSQHGKNRDSFRDVWLHDEGYRVVRFWNHQILTQSEAMLRQLQAIVEGTVE